MTIEDEAEKILRSLSTKAKDKAKDVWNDWKVKSLVEQALSDKQSIRICARAKLKKEYPEVFAELEKSEKDKRETTNQDSPKSHTILPVRNRMIPFQWANFTQRKMRIFTSTKGALSFSSANPFLLLENFKSGGVCESMGLRVQHRF